MSIRLWILAAILVYSEPTLSQIDEMIDVVNRKYDVCVAGEPSEVMMGIRNPINSSMIPIVRRITQEVLERSDRRSCQDLDLCPIPEKWMIPKASLEDLKDQLKRSTFDVSMENSVKKIPKPWGDSLNISFHAYIESISGVDSVNSEFSISMFTMLTWTLDQYRCLKSYKAMAFKGVSVDEKYEGTRQDFFDQMNSNEWLLQWPDDEFRLEPEHFKLFWIPDVYLMNAKTLFAPFSSLDTRFLDVKIVSAKRDPEMLNRGTQNECLFSYVQKMAAKVTCNMNFKYYPIDAQKCYIVFRSFAYNVSDLKINIVDVKADPGIELGNQYLTVNFYPYIEWPRGRIVRTIPGKRSLAVIMLNMNRNLASVFVGVMIPALLVVIIDLSMFWIRIGTINDRIGTGITCLFTLLTQFSSARSAVANNPYVTLMDWFMIMCIMFVVLQMLQTILVYVVYNKEQERVTKESAESQVKKKVEEQEREPGSEDDMSWTKGSASSASTMDPVDNESKSRQYKRRKKTSSFPPYKRNENPLSLTARRRRRIVFSERLTDSIVNPNELPSRKQSFDSRSLYDVPTTSIEERFLQLKAFLLEPTAQKGSPEYLPMLIDSQSRILFPVVVLLSFFLFAILAAKVDERN